MDPWEKHVIRPHRRETWCGKVTRPLEWYFSDADHALNAIEEGTRIAPCKSCLQRIRGLLEKAVQWQNG